MIKLRMADDWYISWKTSSVRLTAFFAFLFGIGPDLLHAWSFIPGDLKDALPEGMGRWIALAAFILVLLGRISKLERKETP